MLNPAYDDGQDNQLTSRSSSEFSLLELIDRILDKGLVINGDITLAIAGTDLLSLKINLVIASLETAKRYGIQLPWEKWEEEKKGGGNGTQNNLDNGPALGDGDDPQSISQQSIPRYGRKRNTSTPQQWPDQNTSQLTKRGKKRVGR